MRDLLTTGRGGLEATCRRAWEVAGTLPGTWVGVTSAHLLGRGRGCGLSHLRLRLNDDNLSLAAHAGSTIEVWAMGPQVIATAPVLPLTAIIALPGMPLSRLMHAACFMDPTVVIRRIIHRPGATRIDVRCRCPVDLVSFPRG